MPTVIDRLRKRLASVPAATYEATDTTITVPPSEATGFPVALKMTGARFVVSCGGWWESFSRAEDAYDCFELGLSSSSRLRVSFRGDVPVEWQLETREFGLWVPRHPVRRHLVPFWRRRRVEHFQNAFL
jgi:hypothetical protein